MRRLFASIVFGIIVGCDVQMNPVADYRLMAALAFLAAYAAIGSARMVS